MITLKSISLLMIPCLFCMCCSVTSVWAVGAEKEAWGSNLVVKRDERRTVLENEFGEISSVKIRDGARVNGSFHLQFFKLEPNALFLPAMLHSEMLLYCHSGVGNLTWIGQGKKSTTVSLSRGDIYRLRQGSVFFIRSNTGTEQRERLRIAAMFANSNGDFYSRFSSMGPYSNIADLVRGFDSRVLQAAFQVPEEVIQTIKSAAKQPLIIQDVSSQQEEGQSRGWEGRFMRVFLSLEGAKMENKKKKKQKQKESSTFNVYTASPDFENCNGWSLTVTSKDLEVLSDSDFGAFYVNLTKGAMMAPHWNPMATEIAFVVAGQGMVRIICSSSEGNQSGCVNQRFRVEEGDVFMVPRFHPVSHTSFNNGSFVFMGFSTSGERNYSQYLVGKESVFQVIDKNVLAAAFNVDNATVVQLSGQQEEALIVECTSCAEEQLSALREEERKKREREEARKREEEARREQERKREEEAAREEEEERRQREEETRRQEEEEGRGGGGEESEEEAARRQEEERERREREEERGRVGGGSSPVGGEESEEEEEEASVRAPEERQPRRHPRRERHQPQEEESKGEAAATRQEEERIRREREQMERARSPIILVDNLDRVMDLLV